MKNNQNSVKQIILDFVMEKWWIFLVLFTALALTGMMEVYPVRLLKRIIDMIISKGKFQVIALLIASWYGLRIFAGFVGFASDWLAGVVGAELGKKFRDLLFERLNLTNYIHLEKASSSEAIVSTLDDVYDLGNMVTRPFVLVGKYLFIFVWSFYFLVQIDGVLLLACLPLGLVMLGAGQWVSGKNRQVLKKQRDYQSMIVNSLLETVSGYREITIFNLWPRQKKVFADVNDGMAKTQRSTAFLTGGLNSFSEALWPLATVICLLLGGYRVLNGNLTAGGMIAFMWYVQWVIIPVSQLTSFYNRIQKSFVAAERIQNMLDQFPLSENKDQSAVMKSEIKLNKVSFSYDDVQKGTINNVDFTVSKGEVVALVGETGCGKSTLLKVILGLLEADDGEIYVDGSKVNSGQLCGSSSMAAVFQDPYLFNISIKDNINLAIKENVNNNGTLLSEALNDACVTPFLNNLPLGENTPIEEGSSNLSSGQKQRVALARALVRKPSLLILDEATSAVDTVTEEKIYQAIFNKYSEMATIIVSHRLASVFEADRIYMMQKGRIIATGTHQELLQSCQEYSDLYGAQLKN